MALMQGYDAQAAEEFILRAMRKAGHTLNQDALLAFIRRAIQADMQYMQQTDVLDEDGLMGEGEYDDDDAFEALLDVLGEDADESELDEIAQLLNTYMAAQQAFMLENGLMEAL